MRSPTFRLRDLLRLNARAAAPLLAVSVPDIYDRLDHLDAETFLRDINFPDAARHLAFEVFSRSFFAEPADLSAAELATMFHIYFLGSSEGLIFDVANANFDVALWNPLRDYLESNGCSLSYRRHRDRCARAAERLSCERTGRRSVRPATALCWPPTCRACGTSSQARRNWVTTAGARESRRLGTAPPFVVHRLWLDRPVNADRAAFLGTGGRAPLDNVSVLDRYEREAAQWARRTGGSVVELHSYAVTGRHRRSARDAAGPPARPLPGDVPPHASSASGLLHAQDCPRFAPGDFAARPTVADAAPGACPGRRRHPHRPAGGADGTRRDHRLGGRQSAARPTSGSRAMPCTACRPQADRRYCDAWLALKGASA